MRIEVSQACSLVYEGSTNVSPLGFPRASMAKLDANHVSHQPKGKDIIPGVSPQKARNGVEGNVYSTAYEVGAHGCPEGYVQVHYIALHPELLNDVLPGLVS